METDRQFSAETEADLWQQLEADLAQPGALMDYSARLFQGPYQTQLDIDVDPGGGFEGGYSLTSLATRVPGHPMFRFALHEQTWLQEIGKLLGQEDIELGYPELDAAFIITTNDSTTLRALLADDEVRATLLRYPSLRLTLEPISLAAEADVLLTFTYEEAVFSPTQLREIYHVLLKLTQQLASHNFAASPLT